MFYSFIKSILAIALIGMVAQVQAMEQVQKPKASNVAYDNSLVKEFMSKTVEQTLDLRIKNIIAVETENFITKRVVLLAIGF